MRCAYIECHSGMAGDMCVGALMDLGLGLDALREGLARLPLSGYAVDVKPVKRAGMRATHFCVETTEQQPVRHYASIRQMVERWEIETGVRSRALSIFDALAQAESTVHATPVEKVHFHEVGAVDSIIDVCATAWGLYQLKIDRIVVSPVNTGSGTVETEHGVLPVPAPATLQLLRGIPIYSDGPAVELTTPTGAAILSSQASEFGQRPAMTPERIGIGAGTRELERANVVRVTLGETSEQRFASTATWQHDEVDVLETHIDDVTPEVLGYVTEYLFNEGALDVSLCPLTMKKNRPGTRLTIIGRAGAGPRLAERVVLETGVLGIRIRRESRWIVPREVQSVETRFGRIRVKVARLGDEHISVTPEYDDCAAAAKSHGVPLGVVYEETRALSHRPPGHHRI